MKKQPVKVEKAFVEGGGRRGLFHCSGKLEAGDIGGHRRPGEAAAW